MERTFLVLGFSMFLLGLILVIVAPIGKRKNKRCSAQTQGTLINIGDIDSGGVSVYSYSVDGVEYKLKSRAYNPNAGNVGESCTIWYNPKKPKDALEYRCKSNKLFNILLIIGIVLLLSPIIMAVLFAALQTR